MNTVVCGRRIHARRLNEFILVGTVNKCQEIPLWFDLASSMSRAGVLAVVPAEAVQVSRPDFFTATKGGFAKS